MQAVLNFSPSPLSRLTPLSFASPLKSSPDFKSTNYRPQIKVAATPNEISTVDYSSMTSVFPAEACETVGGDACGVEMYPEVKLKEEPQSKTTTRASETVDREYLEYKSTKTVFPGEACDDLGGEFCEPEYQSGVY